MGLRLTGKIASRIVLVARDKSRTDATPGTARQKAAMKRVAVEIANRESAIDVRGHR